MRLTASLTPLKVRFFQFGVSALRYNDTLVKLDGAWLFAERLLYVDWREERALP